MTAFKAQIPQHADGEVSVVDLCLLAAQELRPAYAMRGGFGDDGGPKWVSSGRRAGVQGILEIEVADMTR